MFTHAFGRCTPEQPRAGFVKQTEQRYIMTNEQLIPALAGFTLLAVLILAVWQLVSFLRSRRNREIAKKALTE
jgi:hypothetical protein